MLSHQDTNVDHLQAGLENLRVDGANSYHEHQQYQQQQQQQQYYIPKDDSDDDEPLSSVTPRPPQSTDLQVPIPIQNLADHLDSIRPPQYIKPSTQAMNVIQDLPADIQVTQLMYNNYTDKVYLEGYLMKMNDLTVDGTSYGDSQWTRWYVELCGPVLTLWDAELKTTDNNEQSEPVIPQYINLADASVSIVDQDQGVIALNSAGANRFLFQPVDSPSHQAVLWVCAMRLSCFEWSRIHEIYTMKFLTRYNNDVVAATKTVPKMEGFVQVRFTGATDWQKYWTVVSDRRDEKSFFGKKKVPSRGQLHFYDSKKQKQSKFTMVNVIHAYTLYPESPQLIDIATILKVEGFISTSEEEVKESTSALIMVSSRKELVQWLVAIFDSFKLYGRPGKMLDDPLNLNSLNFGEQAAANPRVFLEVADIQHININQDTYIDNTATFAGILLNKMTRQQETTPPMDQRQQQRLVQNNDDVRRSLSGEQSLNQLQASYPSQQSLDRPGMTPTSSSRGGKLIYASDSEDEDEDEDDDDNEDEDSDSDGNNNHSTLSSHKKSVPQSTKKSQQQDLTDDDRSTISDVSESSAPHQPSTAPARSSRPRRHVVRPQASLSGSGSESEEDDDNHGNVSDDSSDDDHHGQTMDSHSGQQPSPMISMPNPSEQFYDQQRQQYHNDGVMYDPATGVYYDEGPAGLEMDEDGPIIPELGSRFATQNSLLDTYRPDHPSANDQMEYSRQTGHTLLSVPSKPPEPRTGLVGMISQIEVDKKEQKMNKGRMLQLEKDRLMEREREKYLWEQRQQMMPQMNMGQSNMGQQVMDQQTMGQMPMMGQFPMMGQMPMMDPRMSMMPPMMSQMPMMGQMPMMDPRMSMVPPSMMNLSNASSGNFDPRMSTMGLQPPFSTETASMAPPAMDPRMSMMPPPMMIDPRMSMMNMQMMMAMYQNNGNLWNQQQQMNQFGGPRIPDDQDDEDDDIPLGGHQNTPKH